MTKNAKLFRLAVWCGPTTVKTIADALRKIGAVDVLEGTERAYWTFAGDTATEAIHRTLEELRREHDTTFGIVPGCLREL